MDLFVDRDGVATKTKRPGSTKLKELDKLPDLKEIKRVKRYEDWSPGCFDWANEVKGRLKLSFWADGEFLWFKNESVGFTFVTGIQLNHPRQHFYQHNNVLYVWSDALSG